MCTHLEIKLFVVVDHSIGLLSQFLLLPSLKNEVLTGACQCRLASLQDKTIHSCMTIHCTHTHTGRHCTHHEQSHRQQSSRTLYCLKNIISSHFFCLSIMKRLDMKMARGIEASPVDITVDSGVTLLSMMSTCTNAKTYDCHRMRSGSSNFSGPTCSYSTKLHVYSTHTVAVTVSRTQVLVMVQQLPW